MILESIIHCIISCYHAVVVRLSELYHFVMIKYITLVKYVLEKLVVCCIFSRFQDFKEDSSICNKYMNSQIALLVSKYHGVMA